MTEKDTAEVELDLTKEELEGFLKYCEQVQLPPSKAFEKLIREYLEEQGV